MVANPHPPATQARGPVYVGTDVLIAYALESDPNHERAISLLNSLPEERIVSDITVFELANRYAKIADKIELELDARRSVRVMFLVEYTLKLAGVRVAHLRPKMRMLRMIDETMKMLEPFCEATSYTVRLSLEPMAVLHLVAARRLGAKSFATLNEEVVRRRDDVSAIFGIEVVTA